MTSLMTSDTAIDFIMKDEIQDILLLDRALISQVMINLIKNAIDAVGATKNPRIRVTMFKDAEWNYLQVEDNGHGVSAKVSHQIFVPFFTTKTTGSGIGLALSRKIVKAHGGFLEYNQKENETCFTMRLPTKLGL